MGDRILVETQAAEEKIGGIWIPDGAKEKPQICIVRNIGNGKLVMNGNGKWQTEPIRVKVGQKILVSKYGGSEIKIDGKEYKLVSPDDILAVIEN